MIVIDVETYSEADIKRVGGWRYCRHPSTEVICVAWAVDDGEVQLWLPGQPEPFFPRGHQFAAHNSFFEWCVFSYVLGWHEVAGRPEDWTDTAALAAAVSLPRSLGEACKALGMPEDLAKSKRGKYLIQRLCSPQGAARKRNRDPALLAEMHDYCRQDVVAERELLRRLPPLTATERLVWQADQRINLRGVAIDRELVDAAIGLVDELTTAANAETRALTGGAIDSMTERDSALELLAAHGCPLPDMRKDTVEQALFHVGPGSMAERLLQLRQMVGKTSTAKFTRLRDLSCVDGRAHGVLMYSGADTGRWAGRFIQPQNLARPTVKDTNALAENVKCQDAAWLRCLYPSEMEALSSVIRSCIVAETGKTLFVADYSAIEARVLAWLAGQEDVLAVFRGDGRIYEHTAARIYKKREQDVTEAERQIGKVATLALGYQGGAGAFQTMARNYGVQTSDEEADAIKVEWREANKRIVALWYDVQNAAIGAIKEPGTIFTVGRLALRCTNNRLWIKLPSNRKLCYHHPKVEPSSYVNKKGDVVPTEQITYVGNDSYTHNWSKQQTYGGSLVENVTQAVARDLLAEAILRCEARGFPVVLHIHDEIVSEVDTDADFDAFIEALCELPAWARGLPIKAAGFVSTRYRK